MGLILKLLLVVVIAVFLGVVAVLGIEYYLFGNLSHFQNFIDRSLGYSYTEILEREVLRGDFEDKWCYFIEEVLMENDKVDEFKSQYDERCPLINHYAFEPQIYGIDALTKEPIDNGLKLIWYIHDNGTFNKIEPEYWYTNLDPYTHEEIGLNYDKQIIYVETAITNYLYFEVVNSTGYLDAEQIAQYNKGVEIFGWLDAGGDNKSNFIFKSDMEYVREFYTRNDGQILPYHGIFIPIYFEDKGVLSE